MALIRKKLLSFEKKMLLRENENYEYQNTEHKSFSENKAMSRYALAHLSELLSFTLSEIQLRVLRFKIDCR